MNYLLSVAEILRQISGSVVPTIAIFKISPMINGVNPAAMVADHERSNELCNQVSPNPKMTTSPRRSAGYEVRNF
jgi:hypothetical protein